MKNIFKVAASVFLVITTVPHYAIAAPVVSNTAAWQVGNSVCETVASKGGVAIIIFNQ